MYDLHADAGTWVRIIDAEDAADTGALGEIAEDLYASLGGAEQRVRELRAELHKVTAGRVVTTQDHRR